MKKINLQYLEENFEDVLDKARNGETYFIQTPEGEIALIPDKERLKSCIESGTAVPIEDSHLWNHDDGA
jgi:hypothetical protein|tara:strand:- start:1656 stop:1862 length:207 start_codon:yes stop_codon:yes gene_type:complete